LNSNDKGRRSLYNRDGVTSAPIIPVFAMSRSRDNSSLLMRCGPRIASAAVGLTLLGGMVRGAFVNQQPGPLPEDAKRRLGFVAGKPVLSSVRGIVFSPDGKLLAVRGEPGDPGKPRIVSLWNAPTGQLLRNIETHDAPLTSVRFSPDGRFLATGQPDHGAGLQIWDARTGARVSRMDGGRGKAHFLPSSREIAVVSAFGSNDVVRVHDVRTGKEVRRFVVEQSYHYVFSPDGSQLLSLRTSGRDVLRIIDIVKGTELPERFEGCRSQPTVFTFGPLGRTVAAASSHRVGRDKAEHHVLVWEVATRRIVHDLTLHTKPVLAMAFSPDGRFLATAGLDGDVRIWELATGKPVHTFAGHGKETLVTALQYSPDGSTLASGATDRTVLLWDAAARSRSSLPAGPLDEKTLGKLWDDLAAASPANAYRAIGQIVAGGEPALRSIRDRVHGILVPSQNKRILQLIAELDHDDSLVRNRAMRELIKLRQVAQPILLRTIKETRSAEVRHRLRRILGGSRKTERFSPADELRMRRIIYAAERAGGKPAEELLELISRNFPELHFPRRLPDLPAKRDAAATLERLRQK
jgi:WD40 repeat protein